MPITWTQSAGKHEIPQNEALYAMNNATGVFPEFQAPRPGYTRRPSLFIGPSRFGTLEILAVVTPPGNIEIFHVMRLRESTRLLVGHTEGEQS